MWGPEVNEIKRYILGFIISKEMTLYMASQKEVDWNLRDVKFASGKKNIIIIFLFTHTPMFVRTEYSVLSPWVLWKKYHRHVTRVGFELMTHAILEQCLLPTRLGLVMFFKIWDNEKVFWFFIATWAWRLQLGSRQSWRWRWALSVVTFGLKYNIEQQIKDDLNILTLTFLWPNRHRKFAQKCTSPRGLFLAESIKTTYLL